MTATKQRKAIFPGTFDPFTIGHMSILERALGLFDEIVVAVGYNEHKPDAADSACERVGKIAGAVARMPQVKVVSYSGLTVDAARRHGCGFILRGVRSVADFEYEQNMAYINRNISGIETVLLYTLPEMQFISSSMVRELQHNGVDCRRFLP